ncbi:MAG: hypothetical protein ABIS92_17185 [Polyangia bacterium]
MIAPLPLAALSGWSRQNNPPPPCSTFPSIRDTGGGSGPRARVITTAGAFAGCEDVHYTPAYPLTVRFLATMYLD